AVFQVFRGLPLNAITFICPHLVRNEPFPLMALRELVCVPKVCDITQGVTPRAEEQIPCCHAERSEASQGIAPPCAAPGFLMKSFDCASAPRRAGILRSLRSLRMTLLNIYCTNFRDTTPAGRPSRSQPAMHASATFSAGCAA